MNLMLNNYCNLKCSYCFAQETMHSANAKNISKENYIKYLDWVKKQNDNFDKEVRMIGGEPTLHPEIKDFIDIAISYGCFRDILIFTNLTFNHEFAEMLVEKNKQIPIHLLPNINSLDLLIPTLRDNILYNLDFLSMNLPTFDRLSINLYSPNQNLTMWEKLCAEYNIQSIRFSIVVPNYEIPKDFNATEYFHSFQPVLKQLIDFKKNYGIEVENDCNPLPLCAFDSDFIQYVLKIDPSFFLKGGNCSHAVMDVTTDLKVINCFGLGTIKDRNLEDFDTVDDLLEELEKDRKAIYQHYITKKECLSCPRFETTGQSCTCLTYRKTEV